MEKIHFHSFDAFRFFAFFKVFIFHSTAIVITVEGTALQWVKDHIAYGGGIGVSFFFVLSGFLITYILAFEKINYGTINLKKFFARRAFRIWPLFYLMVIIAFVIPADFATKIGFYMNWGGYEPDWRYSFTFLENYKTIIMDVGPRTTPLPVFWSLCIEEHFYIVWMFVFFFLKRKWIPVYLCVTIVLAIVARIYHHEIYGTENVYANDLLTNADYFSISGLLGYYTALNYKKLSDFVLRIPFWIRGLYILLVIFILFNQYEFFGQDTWFMHIFRCTWFALMFTSVLLVFLPTDSKLKISDTNIFTRLGKISYGLYVYHIIWIHVTLKYFKTHEMVLDNWKTYLLFISITLGGTIISAILSYRYFEKPFLNLREKLFPTDKTKK